MTRSAVADDVGAQLRANKPDDSSAEEAATIALRVAILRGILVPGQRLRQEDLAEHLGVSRIPLRDAFRRLEAEGLVRIEGRRGAHVATLSADGVAEIYELRLMLEVHCIRLAIRGLTDEAVTRLLEMSEQMDAVSHEDEKGRLSRKAFYAELYHWSGRPRMRNLILQLRDDVHRYHVLQNTGASLEAHAQLRESIFARDAESGARAMRRHLRMAGDDLVESLRREERARGAVVHRGRRRP
jgi:DNA-binding GntR family transcriptional regulator